MNVTIIMLCNYFFHSLLKFNEAWFEILCITVILTFLLLLFGEIMPKVLSRQNPLKFCRMTVDGILFCRKIFNGFCHFQKFVIIYIFCCDFSPMTFLLTGRVLRFPSGNRSVITSKIIKSYIYMYVRTVIFSEALYYKYILHSDFLC